MTNDGSIPGYQQGGKRVGAGAIGLVVECTQKVQAVKLNYPHGDLKPGDVVHMRCITGGHVGTGADCSYAHYHATISTITGHGGPYEDKFENGCGHGAVVEVLPKELTVKCFGPQK
jgi:hypothetical protein